MYTIDKCSLVVFVFNADINSPFVNTTEESNVKFIVRPMHMIHGQAETDHYHIDFNYYATTDSYHLKPLDGESNLLYWYSKDELNQVQNAPRNVIVMAIEALELLSKK